MVETDLESEISETRSRDQDHRDQWVGLVIETETKTQTSKVSRPRLIETKEFLSWRD